jgi:arginyl-tRNA synthetase
MGIDLSQILAGRVVEAAGRAFGVEISLAEAAIRPASGGRGSDYQSNAAMPLAKRLGKPSPAVARAIADHLDATGLAGPPEIAGPGFVNLTFDAAFLAEHVRALAADDRLGVPVREKQRIVIDYSGPNMAKEMHVGHLRSTIIGDALVRLLEHAGHEVIRHNHIGDWGTPFGMLVEHLLDEGHAAATATIADLSEFYTQARRKFDADAAFADRARLRVVALYDGDPATIALWHRLLDESKRHLESAYKLLGVRLTPSDYRGESTYRDELADVVDELRDRGLVRDSDGALCAFPPGFAGRDGAPLPLIVRKSDGGYGYPATDLTAIRQRARTLHPDRLLYVVGMPQRLHFEMVFAVARLAGWLPDGTEPVFVGFGQILSAERNVMRSRLGQNPKLLTLLDEAVGQAAAIVADRPDLGGTERQSIARAVGIGVIKYNDLSYERTRDYTFNWNQMLSTDGNTAVYLQYALARTRSVRRRAGAAPVGAPLFLVTPADRALALALCRFPAAFASTVDELEPHRLCGYLYDLATAYSGFWEHCPVVDAGSDELRASRLALSEHTGRILVRGLDLLGIAAPDKL